MKKRKNHLSLEEFSEFFWSNTVKSPTGCLEWAMARTKDGDYGVVWKEGRLQRANRVALELKLGRKLKLGMHALHTCDNPPCCNWDHLYEGSVKQNVKDAIDRGRFSKPSSMVGSNHAMAKLTETDVLEARELYKRHSVRHLADKYRVSAATMHAALIGKTWKHVKV
jgi:hypothetical protein